MNDQIKKYVDDLFMNIPRSSKVDNLKAELLANMSDGFVNYILDGKTEEEAYELVIKDLSDLDEMVAIVASTEEFAEEAHFYRVRNAKNTALGVALYIIGAAFLIGLGGFGEYLGKSDFYGLVGLLILLVISAFATGLIIYTHMSTPPEYKDYDNEFENEYRYIDRKHARILSSYLSIYWIIVTFIYLTISFLTMRWDLTWIIWIIASAFQLVLKTIFEMKYSKEE